MHESGENYLETILLLEKRNGSVRSIDIARELNFSKPSVSRAVGLLKEAGYITVDKNGYITMTEHGKLEAEQIYEKHQMITEFLVRTIAVNREIAEQDACKMEHILSNETLDGIRSFLNK
ncbi:MAG: metal-dependent transcriptional regulator [bacterium]|nr:metal-dependent transcriptional regulator [bacterium]